MYIRFFLGRKTSDRICAMLNFNLNFWENSTVKCTIAKLFIDQLNFRRHKSNFAIEQEVQIWGNRYLKPAWIQFWRKTLIKIKYLPWFFRLVENSIFGISKKSLQLHKHQLSPFAIYEENSIDGFVRGLTTQATQSFDSSFTEEVSYYVYTT